MEGKEPKQQNHGVEQFQFNTFSDRTKKLLCLRSLKNFRSPQPPSSASMKPATTFIQTALRRESEKHKGQLNYARRKTQKNKGQKQDIKMKRELLPFSPPPSAEEGFFCCCCCSPSLLHLIYLVCRAPKPDPAGTSFFRPQGKILNPTEISSR